MLASIIITLMLSGIILQSLNLSSQYLIATLLLPAQQKTVYSFLQSIKYESIYHNKKTECFLKQNHTLCCNESCYKIFAPLTFSMKGKIGFKGSGKAVGSGTLYLNANKGEKRIAVDSITGIMRIR